MLLLGRLPDVELVLKVKLALQNTLIFPAVYWAV